METIDRLGLLRPLGVDGTTFAVREVFDGKASTELLVAEWIGDGSMSDNDRYELLRRARALMFLGHSKLENIRDIVLKGADAIALCNFVDGEWLEVWPNAPVRPSLGIHVRVMLDVLDALAALHGLRDEVGELLGIAHGGLGPHAVLVGSDGVGRVAMAFRGRRMHGGVPTMAPELRDCDTPATPAADIYAVGAMLRAALQHAGPSERSNSSLDAVVDRACLEAPDDRWPAASAMAMALRAASGPLPTTIHVSAFVRDAFGAGIRARRALLEAQASRPFVLADLVERHSSVRLSPSPAVPSSRLANEPKVQIAPAILDPPTLRRLPPTGSGYASDGSNVASEALVSDDVYRRRLPTIPIPDVRQPFRYLADRRSIATAIAILVAFAIGCFLGGWAWLQSVRPEAPSSSTSPAGPRSP